MSGERERLEAELRQEQARLDQLAREQAGVRERVDRLRVDLARLPGAELPPIVSAEAAGNMTPAGKIALFRRLFRGRDDVYPRLWINAKKDKRGYSPACSNDFVRGICEKPRVKCGECPNQAFLPVDDGVVRDHLQGRHVIGVYPLLADETCWLLAVDFDKDGWQDDVAAFKETCATIGVPVAVERSRSGTGRTPGSSSRVLYRREWREGWGATSSPRRWRGATSCGCRPTIGCSRTRTRCRAGIHVKVYSAAKTIADCFEFRNVVGLDACIDALRQYLKTKQGTVDELMRCAAVCRVAAVIRPYVEALL